jgi:hypothetical protein
MPHAPQLRASERTSTSHPSVIARLQSRNPALHESAQAPAEHALAAFARGGQVVPQPPQLLGSLAVSTSQPFAPLRSQSAKPPLQL